MDNYELRHTEEREGFTIKLHTRYEEDQPDWDFNSEEDKQELLRKIENGSVEWFITKVTAEKNGIVLGTDYLGGCCYESISDFIKPGDYYDSMVCEAIRQANKAIVTLTNESKPLPEPTNLYINTQFSKLSIEHDTFQLKITDYTGNCTHYLSIDSKVLADIRVLLTNHYNEKE